MTTILVWVLVVSSMNSSRSMAEMMGPFADLASCERVQVSAPLKHLMTACVQVRQPERTQ